MAVDRVTLALHEPDDDRIAIAATSRPTLTELQGLRIEPGAWVMGHVYASRRSVVVRDTRELPVTPKKGTPYRTFSFAAVPMLSGADAIGVLAATDKKDGSAFERQDVAALRLFSASAALAVKAAQSEAEAHRLAHAATVDALTGLFNRPYLDARLHQEFERARRGSSSLTLLLADIDDFKTINDTHGHQIGDAVLQAVAGVLRSAVRVFDVCARYGGDEFAILMPSSDQSSVAASAERIRRSVADFGGDEEGGSRLPRVTMSVGVAVIEPGDTPPDLVRRADECLYVAKAEGKNRRAAERAAAAASRVVHHADAKKAFVMSYVLVADADANRTAICLELLDPLAAAARTARSVEDALNIVHLHGMPAVLIVDLALPGDGGFAVIDGIPANRREQTSIIAWASNEGCASSRGIISPDRTRTS